MAQAMIDKQMAEVTLEEGEVEAAASKEPSNAQRAKRMQSWEEQLAPCFSELAAGVQRRVHNGQTVVFCDYSMLPCTEYVRLPIKTEAYGFKQLGQFRDLNCAMSWLACKREAKEMSIQEHEFHAKNVEAYAGQTIAYAPQSKHLAHLGGVTDPNLFIEQYEGVRCLVGLKPAAKPEKARSANGAPKKFKYEHWRVGKTISSVDGEKSTFSATQAISVANITSMMQLYPEGFEAIYDKTSGALVLKSSHVAFQKGIKDILKKELGIELPDGTKASSAAASHQPSVGVLIPAGHRARFLREKEQVARAAVKAKKLVERAQKRKAKEVEKQKKQASPAPAKAKRAKKAKKAADSNGTATAQATA